MIGHEPAAVLHGARDVRIEQREIPEPGADELLIKVAAVGICGSDLHYYEHAAVGPNVVRGPHILGHEVSGVVVAAGSSAAGDRLAKRVVIEPGRACGVCGECATGRYNLCRDMKFLGAPPVDGALRGHIAVCSRLAYALPQALSDEEGALIEPLAVAVHACRRGRVASGSRVLVTGAGSIGLLTAQVAKARGAREVTVMDLNRSRLRLAQKLGATRVISPDELAQLVHEGPTIDVLLECSGAAAALASALAAVRPGGDVVVVGMAPEGFVTLPLEHLQRRELRVTGSFRYAGCFPEAIELAASGQVALDPLITGRYSLTAVDSALRSARDDPTQVKVVIAPDDRQHPGG